MNERLLQFIWQFQYFNIGELKTHGGEKLQIIFPGQFNVHQGPDFSEARIRIGDTTWCGHVELHLRTSDWNRHQHNDDSNYKNVILHVVWENDQSLLQTMPTLELKNRVSKILLERYGNLMNASGFVPCENSIGEVTQITWRSWKERMLVERLVRKSETVTRYLNQCNVHWEETFWWLLARNFGIPVNAEAFESMARSIPLTILSKHKSQIHQLEALLLGQAGLLNESYDEDYPSMLKKEWLFYKKKYGLNTPSIPVFFLRMRPGNFPTVRLAQLAMLIQDSAHLFSRIKEANSVSELKKWFEVTANDYWHYHYKFDELSEFKKKKLGETMMMNVIINTIVPMLFAYGSYHHEEKFKQKALQWLGEITAEENAITKGFIRLGVDNQNAFDSQSLIELKHEYCDKKKCLDCAIGNTILKKDFKMPESKLGKDKIQTKLFGEVE